MEHAQKVDARQDKDSNGSIKQKCFTKGCLILVENFGDNTVRGDPLADGSCCSVEVIDQVLEVPDVIFSLGDDRLQVVEFVIEAGLDRRQSSRSAMADAVIGDLVDAVGEIPEPILEQSVRGIHHIGGIVRHQLERMELGFQSLKKKRKGVRMRKVG